MIRATEAHRPAVEALLGARPELAMFPLANLAAHGISGGLEGGHERAMTFWLDAGDPTALLGVTDGGWAMPLWPEGFDAGRLAPALAGRDLVGCLGPARAVRALLAALSLEDVPVHLSEDEPQFLMSLDGLEVPDGPGALAPLTRDIATATQWRLAYDRELHTGRGRPHAARAEVEGWIAADSHRFLLADGRPVALTGFNARLPDIVQVGGVYTPPEARGRGLARRAVALHLAEARGAGATRATLFAASAAAVACYAPLGFERIGDYAIVLFDGAVTA